MPVQEEPTVESLSMRIDELEQIVKQLKTIIERIEISTKKLPIVPHIPVPGSLGDNTLSIGRRQVASHENEQRLAWERATGAQ